MILPLLTRICSPGARFHVIEAIGDPPGRTSLLGSTLQLAGGDRLSEGADPIRRRRDGMPTVSTERWLRAAFGPPFAKIANLRLTLELDPGFDEDSTLLLGTSPDYRRPGNSPSDIAVDTGRTVAVPMGPREGALQLSDWIVVQLVAAVSANTTFDARLNFTWEEM